MTAQPVPAGHGRPWRRGGRTIGAVAFVLTPWLSLGFGTAIAFLIVAILFGHLGRVHAAVLWLSAALYTAASVVQVVESDSAAGTAGDRLFIAGMLVTMVLGGLEAAVLAVAAVVNGWRPGKRRTSEAAARRRSLAALVLLCLMTGGGGVLAIGVGVVQLPVAVRAAHGQGVHGTVTPTEQNCAPSTSPCSWRGDFVSDDGKVRLHRVEISGHVDAMGEPQPAIYVAGGLEHTVYPPHGSWEWAQWVLVLGFGVAMWWATVVLIIGGWSTRRGVSRH